jgi:ABC-type branched-subunit amino acid transport system ATPase component
MAEPALAVDGLEVRYGAVTAVRDVSFEVAKGEIVGLIGPNGAGKSTTLHAIMGLVRARGGSVKVAGAPVLGHSPEAIAQAGVGLVPEGRRIFADFTVEENLRLGLAALRRRRGKRPPAGA